MVSSFLVALGDGDFPLRGCDLVVYPIVYHAFPGLETVTVIVTTGVTVVTDVILRSRSSDFKSRPVVT